MSARVAVRVTARAGRESIEGWEGDELKIRVSAPPVDGRANDAVCRLLAQQLGVPASAVHIARGGSSRHKLVEVVGMANEEVEIATGRLRRP